MAKSALKIQKKPADLDFHGFQKRVYNFGKVKVHCVLIRSNRDCCNYRKYRRSIS